MGNIGLGRAESLLALGQALWTENQTEATDFTLEIYTGDSSPALLDRLSACPAIRLHGFVSGSDYEKAFESADVFVHVESFEKENRERVRYLVSTKIISCLASGKPLLAYGPEEVASMSYLRRNQCAILAQSPAELPAAIKTVLTQEERRKEIAENARKTAEREAGNSLRLHRILEDSLKKRT